MEELTHIIDGKRVASGEWFDSVNPATQQPWARVARGNADDASRAVAAARRAFDDGPWPRMTPDERSARLHRLADLIEEHTAELAALETSDMGKPVAQCLDRDIPRSVANFRFFADFPRFCEDESLPGPGHHSYTSYEPVGVTAAISPWNFPLMLSTWKVAPALAFGNTVVLKPAEQSPATCTRLGELAIEAGLPDGAEFERELAEGKPFRGRIGPRPPAV
jgi:aminomuconate-semialdehyde/2-hydroxymuconate-6-semialdehyde dehydrogenase